VGGWMLRTEIEHPAVRTMDMVLQVLRGLNVEVESLVGLEGIGHEDVILR
jgi:hypothetical protein